MDSVEVVTVIFPGGRVDDDILQVNGSVITVGTQDNIHQLLESHWCSVESKGEDLVLIITRGSGKGSLMMLGGGQEELPMVLGELKCRDKPSPPQPLDQLVHPWHRVSIKL